MQLKNPSLHLLQLLRLFVLGAAACLLSACEPESRWISLSGSTMGTVYHLTAKCPGKVSSRLQQDIETELLWVNNIMSTYIPDSSLSQFNRYDESDWFHVNPALLKVLAAASDIGEQSGGAFDVTVGPLSTLWGFGADRDPEQLSRPSETEIRQTMTNVGYQWVELRKESPAARKPPDMYIDLSAIAKGYGVDHIAAYLAGSQCENYLVDIGGEVKARGLNTRGQVWRVGVEVPEALTLGAINRIIELPNRAVATSGDYRNFVEWDGETYSHIIDPRTGYPVSHSLASVTVIHESAMLADAYATLLTVLGPVEGGEFAEEHALAALFVWRTQTGFEQKNTKHFSNYLLD